MHPSLKGGTHAAKTYRDQLRGVPPDPRVAGAKPS